MQFTCFYPKILLSKHELFMLWSNIIYYVPYPTKSNFFLELVKAISFSIIFAFRISAMILFIFMSCFSLDLYIYNLNINKMLLLRHLISSKMESLFYNQETQKWQSVVLKLIKLSYFESIRLNQTISI